MIWQFLRRYRALFLTLVLLAVPFLFLRANLKAPEERSPVDRFLLRISGPIQYVFAVIGEGIADVWNDYIYLVDTKEENERLRFELGRVRLENRTLKDVAAENVRLREMLRLRESNPGEFVAARVIGRSLSPFFRVMRIRIDQAEGQVRPMMPVVTHEGLVGYVSSVVGAYADVTLIVDADARVPVVVEETQSSGVLNGTGELDRYAAQIEHLRPNIDDVRVGHHVLTSGRDDVYPRNILVGTVAAITRRGARQLQQVEVAPAVDFSRLEVVLVYVRRPPPPAPETPAEAPSEEFPAGGTAPPEPPVGPALGESPPAAAVPAGP
ncbi:MAG: rod shape-determining protein MreC [Deltaproteobacteria bacterium]|nr:rod shape-determining protein MreC [Deltaproteobacteria bacterium]